MADESQACGVEPVFEALADAECREILDALDEPRTAPEVAEACDLPQTNAYRKLEKLSVADLVAERTALCRDGHHATAYERDFSGVVVDYDGTNFGVTVVEDESPDERLARFWTQISEEL